MSTFAQTHGDHLDPDRHLPQTEFTQSQLEDWKRYERVRKGGRYNMIVDSHRAMRAAGLSRDRYLFVIEHYEAIEKAVKGASDE